MLLTGELEKVMDQLKKKEAECESLVDAQSKTIREVDEKLKRQALLEETIRRLQSQMKQLNHEVDTKSDLVS